MLPEIAGIIGPNRSGRGDAHPRVTGCTSSYGAFKSLEEVRTYMKDIGVTQAKEVTKADVGETAPLYGSGFYTVVNRVNLGIYGLYR